MSSYDTSKPNQTSRQMIAKEISYDEFYKLYGKSFLDGIGPKIEDLYKLRDIKYYGEIDGTIDIFYYGEDHDLVNCYIAFWLDDGETFVKYANIMSSTNPYTQRIILSILDAAISENKFNVFKAILSDSDLSDFTIIDEDVSYDEYLLEKSIKDGKITFVKFLMPVNLYNYRENFLSAVPKIHDFQRKSCIINREHITYSNP